MRTILRGLGVMLLLTLFVIPTTLLSQDDDTINVIGSRIVTDVFDALIDALPTPLESEVIVSPSGTTTGFEGFCQGIADITGATRPISVSEESLCLQNGIAFSEYLLGYDAIAVIAHPELEALSCLSTFDLSDLFAPSAEGVITDWSQTSAMFEDIEGPISIFLPPDNSTTYVLLDSLVEGLNLRRDVTTEADNTGLIAAVSSTPGAVGVVSLSALTGDEDLHVMQLVNPDLGSCFRPDVETIEQRLYPGASRVLIYASQDALQKPSLRELLAFATGEESAPVVQAAGLVAPSENTYAVNEAILMGEGTGRQFSLEVVSFEISPSVMGMVNIGGAANLFNYVNQAGLQFNSEYPGVTVNINITGQSGGLRQFCNGEINILTTDQEFPDLNQPLDELRAIFGGLDDQAQEAEAPATPEEEADTENGENDEATESADAAPPIPATPLSAVLLAAQNCNANNVTPFTIDLGKRAVVLVANAESDYLTCLSSDQILTIWQADSTEQVTNWQDMDASLPDAPMYLFAPAPGQGSADLLLTPPQGNVLPMRLDVTEQNNDPLYRAAAVANAPGSLTFMSWREYQRVLENGQANIQLTAVDSGEGCVTPAEQTIVDGSYPLIQDNKLIVNRAALSRPEMQSLLWYMFSDANFSLIENAELLGLSFGDLPALRDRLQTAYSDVTTEAAIAELEALEQEAAQNEAAQDAETADDDNAGDAEDGG